jgi:hypothetical protein
MRIFISNEGRVILDGDSLCLRISFTTESIAHITSMDGKPFLPGSNCIVSIQSTFNADNLQDNLTNITDKESGGTAYFDQPTALFWANQNVLENG